MLNALRHQRIQQPPPWRLGRARHDVLNALRHQRIQQSASRGARVGCSRKCSTPYGIRESSSGKPTSTTVATDSAQRLTASENPAAAERGGWRYRQGAECSTPYGIRESSSAGGPAGTTSGRDVLNALRHQRIQQPGTLRGAGRGQHSGAQRLTASENPAAGPPGARSSNQPRAQRLTASENPAARRPSTTWSPGSACAQRLTASENPAVFPPDPLIRCAQRLTASENPAVFPPDPLIRQGSRQAKSSTSHETARNPLWAHHSTLETGMALRLRAIQAPFCSRRWPQTQSRHRLDPPGSAAPQPFTPQCLISPPTESHAQVSSP